MIPSLMYSSLHFPPLLAWKMQSNEDFFQRCLKVLLEFGASVSLTNHIGMTPLHCAASSGHVDCCIQLLRSGAQIDALNLVSSMTLDKMCLFLCVSVGTLFDTILSTI